MNSQISKLVALTSIAVVAIAIPAFAADMLQPRSFVAPPPAPSWTGFYIGGNLGYAIQRDSSSTTDFDQPTALLPDNPQFGTASATSFTGGVQAGYNYQFTPNLVAGLEGDWDWMRASDSLCRSTTVTAALPGVAGPGALECSDDTFGFMTMSERTDWLASARGRLGWIFGNVLFYGTGGVAWARVDTTITANCASGPGCGASTTANTSSYNFSDTKTGWVGGLGAEAMLGRNWTARIEWLHYGFGTLTDSVNVVPPPATDPNPYTMSWSRSLQYDTIRLGANYRF